MPEDFGTACISSYYHSYLYANGDGYAVLQAAKRESTAKSCSEDSWRKESLMHALRLYLMSDFGRAH